jgi:hypothetical protein
VSEGRATSSAPFAVDMLTYAPPRTRALAVAIGAGLGGVALTAIGVTRLAHAGFSPLIVLWTSLPLVGAPLALWSLYHGYGLATAGYGMDREGCYLRWGWSREQIPVDRIESVRRVSAADLPQPPQPRLPGFLLGAVRRDGEPLEYFATAPDHLVLIEHDQGALLISPESAVDFVESFAASTRLGSLEPLDRLSLRPDLLPARMWLDRIARLLLLAGLLLPLGLLGYLGVQAPTLPAAVPFGFGPEGGVGPAAPIGRLLLLPLAGGLIWMIDLLVGAWFYRRAAERAIAYATWGLAVVVGLLLWAAGLAMLASTG